MTTHDEGLQTREQKHRAAKWDRMFFSRRHILSKAVMSLRTQGACQVFLVFLNKCVLKKVQTRPGRSEREYVIANNGEIQFTYREALEKYGIPAKRFTRIIDELIGAGLIDIAHTGFGLHKDVTLYSISDRWANFGTANFIEMQRPKRKDRLGFTKAKR